MEARDYYIKPTYKNWTCALNDLHNYYHLFPHFQITDVRKNPFLYEIYKSLVESNAKVLCVLVSDTHSKGSTLTAEWHPLTSQSAVDQVYFWSNISGPERKIIGPILQSIGMKISPAPARKVECFNTAYSNSKKDKSSDNSTNQDSMMGDKETAAIKTVSPKAIPSVSPSSVFKYYTAHSKYSILCGIKPCPINETVFRDADTFLLFVKYLVKFPMKEPSEQTRTEVGADIRRRLQSCVDSSEDSRPHKFPDSPFSHFLLLSADGMLKTFDADYKILSSHYHKLFPRHLNMFLHPALRVVHFDASYFIFPEHEVEKKEPNVPRILSLFSETLPHQMIDTKVVSNASGIISKEDLSCFWRCFKEDQVFACYLPNILEHCALVLTKDNRLFSTSNEVLPSFFPVIPDQQIDLKSCLKHVCAIMQSLQMPFINRDVVIAQVDCPTLLDHGRILSNFCHTNASVPLTSVLKNTSHIDTLILYFSSAAASGNPEWVKQISSLPFFTDVLGNYIPIANQDAYIWPSLACDVGYSCWVRHFNAIFLRDNTSWKHLGSVEQLKINIICVEKVYTQFIFPNFHLLNEDERYAHLEHIRNIIFTIDKGYKDRKISEFTSDEEREKIMNAREFIEKLTDLKCIGSDHSSLLPISAFCVHNIKIFRVFPSDFQTLPKKLQSNEWLEFFKDLGLKQMLTTQDYLKLCTKTANQEVKNVKECSMILLEYIFSPDIRKLWCADTNFLKKVSRINFVFTCDTSPVNWIVSGKCQVNQLVPLNGAASSSLMNLAWTVKPIINLPYPCSSNFQDRDTKSLLNTLNISTCIIVADVESNLRNISSSCYSNENLFENYPERLAAPESSATLLGVLHDNLQFLNKHLMKNPDECKFLASRIDALACIPVYCDVPKQEARRMVLVKPSSVLDYDSPCVTEYHPYLHCVPREIRYYTLILTEIGVKQKLDMHHMQIVLEKISICSKGERLDPNSKECVKKAVEFLYVCLSSSPSTASMDGKSASLLSPLYLPDTNDELKLSTNMLYCDTHSYFGEIILALSGTRYSHFDVIEDSYGVCALDISRLLPEQVRPHGMSIKCKQVPGDVCDTVEHSDFARDIEDSLQYQDNPMVVVKVYKKFIPTKISEDELKCLVTEFFCSVKVLTKVNLQTQIVLRESNREIGHIKSDFYLEVCESPCMLYIDCDYDYEDSILTDVTEHLYNVISRKFPAEVMPNLKSKLINFLVGYLKAKPSKKAAFLKSLRIKITSNLSRKFQVELGESIPECFHHRLDEDSYNIFRPMEYVGYEGRVGNIVVAQVVHLVESADTNQLTKVYRIYTSKMDEDGKDVSILTLYKFLKSTKNSVSLASTEDFALVPYTEQGEATNLRRSIYEGDLSEIKERIRSELRDIWKLNQDLRKQAIRRLYLKWHPDKNLNNTEMAGEIFTFLSNEIDRLNARGDTTVVSDFNRNMWDHMATRQREARQSEEACQSNHTEPRQDVFDDVNNQTMPEEGNRWVEQAETDYNVLCVIHSEARNAKGYGHVCFMAHQVTEKALKGAVYALCGMDGRGLLDHNLSRHAHALQTAVPESTQGLAENTYPLESYYVDTRYPNCWPGYTDTPSDHYDENQANKAKDHSKFVLDIVRNIMP